VLFLERAEGTRLREIHGVSVRIVRAKGEPPGFGLRILGWLRTRAQRPRETRLPDAGNR
jgi:hypothetical protein